MSAAAALLEARVLGALDPDEGLGLEWEELVRSRPESGFMQSLRWAGVRAAAGAEAVHVGLFADGRLRGGVLWHGPVRGADPALLVAPDGPVLPWDAPALIADGWRRLMDTTRALVRGRGIVALRAEPRLAPPAPGLLRDFHRAPVDLMPSETLYLDVRPEPDELLAAMHPKWRYNIRLAGRSRVEVRESRDLADLGQLYPVLEEAAGRGEFFLEPLSFFTALHEQFVKPGLARLLVAEHEGRVLAGMLLVTYGSRATYLYGGTANVERQRMAGYALQWAAITAARAAGCTTYDFYGYEPFGAPEHLFAGFSRFKRGFGGLPVRFIGAHDHVLVDNLADTIVRLIGASRERSFL